MSFHQPKIMVRIVIRRQVNKPEIEETRELIEKAAQRTTDNISKKMDEIVLKMLGETTKPKPTIVKPKPRVVKVTRLYFPCGICKKSTLGKYFKCAYCNIIICTRTDCSNACFDAHICLSCNNPQDDYINWQTEQTSEWLNPLPEFK